MLRPRSHHGPGEGRHAELEAWRSAAKRVARTWNAWLAADGRERPRAYAAYLEALAEEERAAVRVQHARLASLHRHA